MIYRHISWWKVGADTQQITMHDFAHLKAVLRQKLAKDTYSHSHTPQALCVMKFSS
jgi:hypothetical protein